MHKCSSQSAMVSVAKRGINIQQELAFLIICGNLSKTQDF